MAIRTQLRLPQLSGSIKHNAAAADNFSIFSDLGNAPKTYLAFASTTGQEMTVVESVDFKVTNGNIRVGADLSLFDASNHERVSMADAGTLELRDADGTQVLQIHASDLSTTLAGDVSVAGNIVGDANEAKAIFVASTTPSNAITLGGGADVICAGDLQVNGTEIDVDSASALNIGATVGANAITLGGTTSEVQIPGNLIVQGSRTYLESTEVVIEDKALALGVPSSLAKPNVVGAAVSDANPGVITSAAHGFLDDEYVYLYGHSGSTIVDGVYQVKNKATNTFQIRAAGAGSNLDTSSESGATTINHSGVKVTDAGAAGGGIQLPHQDGLASIGWDHTHGWQFSEDVDLASGKHLSFGGRQAMDIDSNKIRFSLNTAGGELLSLPAADGSANEFLTTNGSGQLSFSSAGTLVPVRIPNKTAFQLNTKLTKNNPLSGTSYSALDVSSRVLLDANLPHQIDVFVNGQLLQSGSGPYGTDVGDNAFTSGDYLGNMNRSALDLKFSFDLESGDVVQIMEKPEGRA